MTNKGTLTALTLCFSFLTVSVLTLTTKLLNQWFLLVKLKSSLRKFFGHYDLVSHYGISVSQMTTYIMS